MHYKLQVANDILFKDIVLSKTLKTITEYSIGQDLDYFGVYYWRVRSVNEVTGQYSEWSDPCMFRVMAEDVVITQKSLCNRLTMNTLIHRFIRSYDVACEIPKAKIGVCMNNTVMKAEIGVCYCAGSMVNQYTGISGTGFIYSGDEEYTIISACKPCCDIPTIGISSDIITNDSDVQGTFVTDALNTLNTNINSVEVDIEDIRNEIANINLELDGKLDSVVAGQNITIDNTDPNNPIITSLGVSTEPTVYNLSGSSSYTINHNKGYYPDVYIIVGGNIVYSDINHSSINTIIVTFSTVTSCDVVVS